MSDPILEPIAAAIAKTFDDARTEGGTEGGYRPWLNRTALDAARAVYLAIGAMDWKLITGERLFQLERLASGTAQQETAVMPPERHSPGPTGGGEGSDTPEGLNEAPRAAEPHALCHACGRPRYPEHDADAPGPTVKHPFKAASAYGLEVLGEALRATGIKVEDVNPRHLREALIETSGPPWGQGRGAYLAGLLGAKLQEDAARASDPTQRIELVTNTTDPCRHGHGGPNCTHTPGTWPAGGPSGETLLTDHDGGDTP